MPTAPASSSAPSSASSGPAANPRDALIERVQRAVNDVSYPAHPGTLIDAAGQAHADAEVLDALRALPNEAFGSFPEVCASIVAGFDARAEPRRDATE